METEVINLYLFHAIKERTIQVIGWEIFKWHAKKEDLGG